MTKSDYFEVLELVRRLDRDTRARLVGEIVRELAGEPIGSPRRGIDPREALAEIRAHFVALGPVSPTVGDQLERDRQSRADVLEGRVRDDDGHH